MITPIIQPFPRLDLTLVTHLPLPAPHSLTEYGFAPGAKVGVNHFNGLRVATRSRPLTIPDTLAIVRPAEFFRISRTPHPEDIPGLKPSGRHQAVKSTPETRLIEPGETQFRGITHRMGYDMKSRHALELPYGVRECLTPFVSAWFRPGPAERYQSIQRNNYGDLNPFFTFSV